MRTNLVHTCLVAALLVGAAANTLAPAAVSASTRSCPEGLTRQLSNEDRGLPAVRGATVHGDAAKGWRGDDATPMSLGTRDASFGSNDWGDARQSDFRQPNVLAADNKFPVQRARDKPVTHVGKKQWLRTLHIRGADGSNTLVNVHVTATAGITVSYDPASQTVSGYGGPGTVTVTGEVETTNGNVPFELTIPVN